METLSALQDKIEQLIALVRELRAENEQLDKDNKQLVKKLQSIESNITNSEHDIKELSDEKIRTRMVVDDLIKSIDSFVGNEKQL